MMHTNYPKPATYCRAEQRWKHVAGFREVKKLPCGQGRSGSNRLHRHRRLHRYQLQWRLRGRRDLQWCLLNRRLLQWCLLQRCLL